MARHGDDVNDDYCSGAVKLIYANIEKANLRLHRAAGQLYFPGIIIATAPGLRCNGQQHHFCQPAISMRLRPFPIDEA